MCVLVCRFSIIVCVNIFFLFHFICYIYIITSCFSFFESFSGEKLDNRNQRCARCNRLGNGNRYIAHTHTRQTIQHTLSVRIMLQQYCTHIKFSKQNSVTQELEYTATSTATASIYNSNECPKNFNIYIHIGIQHQARIQ